MQSVAASQVIIFNGIWHLLKIRSKVCPGSVEELGRVRNSSADQQLQEWENTLNSEEI